MSRCDPARIRSKAALEQALRRQNEGERATLVIADHLASGPWHHDKTKQLGIVHNAAHPQLDIPVRADQAAHGGGTFK